MFTGIVSDIGEIVAATDQVEGALRRLRIACSFDPATIAMGASISCNGVCLTVVATGRDGARNWFEADAGAETLRLTTAADWRIGARLNLERALKVGDELGGHIVLGHVDGIARVVSRENLPDMARFMLEAPHALARFIAQKGSVCLDGVSLTVNSVIGDRFSVLIIPHTLKVTTLGTWQDGSRVNLEVDQLARYAARLSETA
jgi:riboflavin synthase